MSHPQDPREWLDVEMHELAGPRPFVPDHRSSWRQMRASIQADADQPGGDRRARDLQPDGNPPGRLSFVARRDNRRDRFLRRAPWLATRARQASSSASRPPKRYLRSHLYAVRTLMPAAAAASAGGHWS
jgi:hypothetical protein